MAEAKLFFFYFIFFSISPPVWKILKKKIAGGQREVGGKRRKNTQLLTRGSREKVEKKEERNKKKTVRASPLHLHQEHPSPFLVQISKKTLHCVLHKVFKFINAIIEGHSSWLCAASTAVEMVQFEPFFRSAATVTLNLSPTSSFGLHFYFFSLLLFPKKTSSCGRAQKKRSPLENRVACGKCFFFNPLLFLLFPTKWKKKQTRGQRRNSETKNNLKKNTEHTHTHTHTKWS